MTYLMLLCVRNCKNPKVYTILKYIFSVRNVDKKSVLYLSLGLFLKECLK